MQQKEECKGISTNVNESAKQEPIAEQQQDNLNEEIMDLDFLVG